MSNPILSWRRVRALCVKETRQIVRDPSSWLIAVVIPLLLLFIFGYGINLDSSKLRVGILLEQRSEAALDFTHTMTGSPYIDATISDNRQELIAKMQAGKIRGLVVIPVDFAEQMERANATAPIQVITDGSEPNTANFVQGYVEGIWQIWQMQRAEDNGQTFEPLIDVQTRYWFNPAAISQHFIIPGAVTIIMTVIGAILTSLVVAREWERGTMEALLSTEITRTELLLCKLIPYYFPRDAGDVAVYAGVSVYSRRAVSRVAADSVFYLQPVFTQYPGDGAADFHDYPQPVQCRSGRPERRFSAVDYAFRLYFSDRQYARGDPRGDVHYSRSLFRQHPAKPVPRREYSSGAGGKRAVFDRFGGDVYRPDVAENQTSAGLGRRACFIAYGR